MTATLELPTTQVSAPFRADHVGSYLRPEVIKRARQQFDQQQIDYQTLRHIEDHAISELVDKQKSCGLLAVTDGELRRSWWHLDFFAGLMGLQKKTMAEGYHFQGVTTRAETVEITAPIEFGNHPMLADFRFLQSIAGDRTAKYMIPGPAMLHYLLAIRNEHFSYAPFYANEVDFSEAIINIYQQALQAFYDAGCRYLQLDDTSWGGLFAENKRQDLLARGINPDKLIEQYVAITNAAVKKRPTDMTVAMHICRGNFRSQWLNSGGYEPIAAQLFKHGQLDAFFLEYDSERSGDFSPLRFIQNQRVVLGLISSKDGQLEDKQMVKKRIHEAAHYVDIDQLGLSTQCGFSSTEEGNLLTEDQQWQKIRLVVEIANEVWH